MTVDFGQKNRKKEIKRKDNSLGMSDL